MEKLNNEVLEMIEYLTLYYANLKHNMKNGMSQSEASDIIDNNCLCVRRKSWPKGLFASYPEIGGCIYKNEYKLEQKIVPSLQVTQEDITQNDWEVLRVKDIVCQEKDELNGMSSDEAISNITLIRRKGWIPNTFCLYPSTGEDRFTFNPTTKDLNRDDCVSMFDVTQNDWEAVKITDVIKSRSDQ